MLQALELVGFKSFAERTRFEFPPGITVIVGPNGSGKSNVVDAVRWVLGEQSAKSLRGREMADVIFNGSATRRPLATAEVTLSFDNRTGMLPLETPQVHVTRRVYRSGEGEYLINRQPARLRDVRELFAGTGAATEAYSIIEQGKVDVLLQASPRDRRMIFEEAAGISRFKAKKIEAERRLERVEQNLLRLKDVVDELEGRLKSVRAQAGKARRYREHSERLKALRTALAQVDSVDLASRLASIEGRLAELKALGQKHADQAHERKLQLDEADDRLARQADDLRRIELAQAQNRERIVHQRDTIAQHRRRLDELHGEAEQHRRHASEHAERLAALAAQADESSRELAEAQAVFARHHDRLAQTELRQRELLERQSAARTEVENRRAAYVGAMRAAAALANEASGSEAELAALAAQRQRLDERGKPLAAALEMANSAARQSAEARAAAQSAAQALAAELAQTLGLLAELRQQSAQLAREQGRLRQRHTAATERAALLEEFERRCEGLEVGTKELLLKSREANSSSLGRVHGLVADLLHVRLETAAAVEQALGDASHALVVDSAAPFVERCRAGVALPGRVSLIGLDVCRAPLADDESLRGQAGVVARADELVETTDEYRELARKLLAGAWIVESLAAALELSAGAGSGKHLITLAGDSITPAGRLTFGPRPTVAGPLSRRSELRALTQQIAELDGRLAETEGLAARLEHSIAQTEARHRELDLRERQTNEAIAERRSQATLAESQLAQVREQLASIGAEVRWVDNRRQAVEARLRELVAEQKKTESSLVELDGAVREAVAALAELERGGGDSLAAITSAKVELARSEQRLEGLRAMGEQLGRDADERRQARDRSQALAEAADEKAQSLAAELEAADQERLRLEQEVEQSARAAAELESEHTAKREERGALAAAWQAAQEQLQAAGEELHQAELAAQALRHQRDSLAERLREDYGLELADLGPPPAEPLIDRDGAEREIAELRRKVQQLGHVNLDALEELDGLEERFSRLSAQHDDLSQARSTLTALIRRVNEDSRRLFAATLESVRGHFQELFRKLFGGGQADIIVEADVDLLDSGVEIVARPPGKELRSISLLSGGEKTLTCAALLLAIFRSRPSPFCILDEVDAALDEANIDRFIGVLQEFAGTQFIVVTHSKKTMTCAQTLYGVTMQESGVSKRVAVRFEDVRDDGQIVDRGDEQEAA